MQRTCLSIIALVLLLSHLSYSRVEKLEQEEVTRSSENARLTKAEDDDDSSTEEESIGLEDSTAPSSEIAEEPLTELEIGVSPSPKPLKSSPSPREEGKPSLEPSMEMPKGSIVPPSSSPVPRRRRRHPKDPIDDEPSVERRFIYETHDSDGSSSDASSNSEVTLTTEGGSESSTNSPRTSTSKGSNAGLVFGVLFAVGTVVVLGGFIGYKAWQRIQLSRYRGWRPYDVEMIELQSHW